MLERITLAVESIRDMNRQIATAAEEQTSVAEDISRNLTEITSIASTNLDNVQRTEAASHNLHGLVGAVERGDGSRRRVRKMTVYRRAYQVGTPIATTAGSLQTATAALLTALQERGSSHVGIDGQYVGLILERKKTARSKRSCGFFVGAISRLACSSGLRRWRRSGPRPIQRLWHLLSSTSYS